MKRWGQRMWRPDPVVRGVVEDDGVDGLGELVESDEMDELI